MKISRRNVTVGGLSALAGTSLSSITQADTADAEPALSDAVDAYVYGYPLVMMEITRRIQTNVRVPSPRSAPMGQFAHYRTFPTPTTQEIAGENVDTLYSIAWL